MLTHSRNKIFFLIVLLTACHSPETRNEREPPAVKDQFITSRILKNDPGLYAVFMMFPSFCGSCNIAVMTFINEFEMEGCKKIYVVPAGDTARLSPYNLTPEAIVAEYDAMTIQKHGFRGSSNYILLVNSSEIIYESQITPENIEAVRNEIKQIKTTNQ